MISLFFRYTFLLCFEWPLQILSSKFNAKACSGSFYQSLFFFEYDLNFLNFLFYFTAILKTYNHGVLWLLFCYCYHSFGRFFYMCSFECVATEVSAKWLICQWLYSNCICHFFLILPQKNWQEQLKEGCLFWFMVSRAHLL